MYNKCMGNNWKEIKGYEGLYKVTDTGKVWSVKKQKFLTPGHDRGCYERVILSNNKVKRHFLVHRLVYTAFCGEIPSGLYINHKNELKTDNRLENLELVTCQQNNTYGTRIKRAIETYRNNLEARNRKCIRLVEAKSSGSYFFHSYKKASKYFGDTYGAFKMRIQKARRMKTNRITINGVEYIIKEA